MRDYDPDQPLIFTHIPKCAGSSFIGLLRSWFGPTYHKLNQDESQDILLPRIVTGNKNGDWLKDVKCIHGHFNHGRGYGLPYFYPEINQYITVLRDPFDIVVSMYFFAKGRSSRGEFWFRGKQVDLREEYPTIEHYVRDYPYWLFDHIPRDINLSNYKQVLSDRFVYMGIFSNMQHSIDRMAYRLGKPTRELPRVNVSNYDEPVPEYLRQRFYNNYPLLKKIYDFALENQ